MRKQIYIVYTGGTIGMQKRSDGYVPLPGYLDKLMAAMPELKHPHMPKININAFDPLIDSADMEPDDWLKIADTIAVNYNAYDGFIVLHGTDTMSYTAAALSFMLEGLAKPVILTGGQIPLCEIRNDSRENLISAIMIAADFHIPEVCLFFGSKLIRGNRAVKINSGGFDAFDSPNYPPLGIAGVRIDIQSDLLLPAPAKNTSLTVAALRKTPVAAVRLFPGISADVVANIIAPPVRGVVLETFGLGNVPSHNIKLLEVLKVAIDRGVVIVNCTQCLKGRVEMQAYATGQALERIGVISGYDMTAEAALAKMFYLFGRKYSIENIKKLMQKNLKGELVSIHE
jgi:L-asparaginase